MAKMSMEQFEAKVKKWAKEMPDLIEVSMSKAGNIVRNEVVVNHLSGPKMARGVGHPTMATLKPQSGDLRSSINVKVTKRVGRVIATIGSSMKYARIHEKGGRIPSRNITIPKRSYLEPSVDKKREQVKQIILDGVMNGYRRAHVR